MHFEVECLGATWRNDLNSWEVRFKDMRTKVEYSRLATAFVSAVGGISYPRDVRFPGMETFEGEMFHTARWDHSYDYSGKRIAVIGNGCSAAQVVPTVTPKAKYVRQYARSPQSVRNLTFCFLLFALPLSLLFHVMHLFLTYALFPFGKITDRSIGGIMSVRIGSLPDGRSWHSDICHSGNDTTVLTCS